MKTPVLYNNFRFVRFNFSSYHYTDSRFGSSMNYLAYMIKGSSRIASPEKTISVNEGEVFYIPKELKYQSYWYGDEIEFLSFGFFHNDTSDDMSFDLQVLPSNRTIIEKLLEIPTDSIVPDCRTLSVFYDVLAMLLPDFSRKPIGHKSEIIKKAKDYIAYNPFCTMTEVAKHASVSEAYLYTIFRETGTTPNNYRQEALCKRAVELLTITDRSIEEISGMLNFSSSSYFRKLLKKHIGHTPLEIRKNSNFRL